MYVMLYNRLTGWLWFIIGAWGLFSPTIGDYVHLTPVETYVSLGMGLLGMFGARLGLKGPAFRNQVLTCAVLTLCNLLLLILTSAPSLGMLFRPTPLESMLQMLAFLWGAYCLYEQIKLWVISVREPA